MDSLHAALRREPELRDKLVLHAGTAATQSHQTRKHYARSVGISVSRASRRRRGDQHSDEFRFLAKVAMTGNPWPLINQAIAVAIQQSIRAARTADLKLRLAEINDREHEAEASENRSTCNVGVDASPAAQEAAAQHDINEAMLQLERSAIRRELARPGRRRA